MLMLLSRSYPSIPVDPVNNKVTRLGRPILKFSMLFQQPYNDRLVVALFMKFVQFGAWHTLNEMFFEVFEFVQPVWSEAYTYDWCAPSCDRLAVKAIIPDEFMLYKLVLSE